MICESATEPRVLSARPTLAAEHLGLWSAGTAGALHVLQLLREPKTHGCPGCASLCPVPGDAFLTLDSVLFDDFDTCVAFILSNLRFPITLDSALTPPLRPSASWLW